MGQALAAAHSGQHSMGFASDALELYEGKKVWDTFANAGVSEMQSGFQSRAAEREAFPEEVSCLECLGADIDSLTIRFRTISGNGKDITSYTIIAKDQETGDVYRRHFRLSPGGVGGPPRLERTKSQPFEVDRLYTCHLTELPRGRCFSVVAFAWNGFKGPESEPMLCQTPSNSLHGTGQPRPVRMLVRRQKTVVLSAEPSPLEHTNC